MSAIATLALKNHAAATVNFTPDTVRGGDYAKWEDRTAATFAGTPYVSMTRKASPDANGVRKCQLKLVIPSVDGVTGLVKYKPMFTAQFDLPNSATLSERQELLARVKELVISSVVNGAVLSNDHPW